MSRFLFKKVKTRPPIPLPRPPEVYTARDAIRDAYRQAGALDLLPKLRDTPTDLQRILDYNHLPRSLADGTTKREALELLAALSGLPSSHNYGTLPELVLGTWLKQQGFSYGGMGYEANLSADYTFQVPLTGGRSVTGGGAVVDFFLSPNLTGTDLGVAVRVQTSYYHRLPDNIVRDEASRKTLELAGYKVADVWDYQIYEAGTLDQVMRGVLAGVYP